MVDITFETEAEIYDMMSQAAGRAALSAATNALALIQKGMKDDPKNAHVHALAGGPKLTAREQELLESISKEDLNKAWRKVIRTVDLSIGFIPELERLPRTQGLLVRPGDIVKGADAMGFPGMLANWEVEIDLGIIRGKVSW